MLPADIRSSLTLVAGPNVPVLTLAQAKTHLRVDFGDDDVYIQGLIDTALGVVDGRDGELGRALISQQWELRLDGFGWSLWKPDWAANPRVNWGRIALPLPPLLTVDSVKYIDTDGVLQTLSASIYQVVTGGARRAELLPAYGLAWPAPRPEPDCVRITFTAGFGTTADKVPAAIRQAMLLLIGAWYENRESTVIASRITSVEWSDGVQRLLSRYLISWF